MTNWTRVGGAVGIGMAGGALSQLAENADAKRQAERVAGGQEPLKLLEQVGTYVDFGLPLLGVLGVASGFIRSDMVNYSVLAAGGALAGKRATWMLTKEDTEFVPFTRTYQGRTESPFLGSPDVRTRKATNSLS